MLVFFFNLGLKRRKKMKNVKSTPESTEKYKAIIKRMRVSRFVIRIDEIVRHGIIRDFGVVNIPVSPQSDSGDLVYFWSIRALVHPNERGYEKFRLELWDGRRDPDISGYFQKSRPVPLAQGTVPVDDGYIILPAEKPWEEDQDRVYAGKPLHRTQEEYDFMCANGLKAVYNAINYKWRCKNIDAEECVKHTDLLCVRKTGEVIELSSDWWSEHHSRTIGGVLITLPNDALFVLSSYTNVDKSTGHDKRSITAHTAAFQYLLDYEKTIKEWLGKVSVSGDHRRRKIKIK
jgi:hypothetical protein